MQLDYVAAELEDVTERLGGRQADESRIEDRQDLLLSTLPNYLAATGAQDARIVVTVDGLEYELALSTFTAASREPAGPTR